MDLKCLPIPNELLIYCKVLNDRMDIFEYIDNNMCIAEIGVGGGDFSEHLLNKSHKLYLLDIYIGNDWPSHNRYNKDNHYEYIVNKFKNNNNVQLMKGYIVDLLNIFCQKYFDLIYIDGGCEPNYFTNKKILFTAYSKLKLNGLLWINDYTTCDPVLNITYGVQKAVNELINKYKMDVVYLSLNSSNFHDICIKKTRDMDNDSCDLFENQLKLLNSSFGPLYSFKNQHNVIQLHLDTYLKRIMDGMNKNDIMLDVGAGVGAHVLACNQKVKYVYTFEYQNYIHQVQQRNIKLNGIQNVITIKAFVGHIDNVYLPLSEISLEGEVINKSLSKGIDGCMLNKGIKMRTIDSFNFEDRIGYIKINSPGCLPLVLYGGQYTIRKDRPVIIFKEKNDTRLLNEIKESCGIPIQIENFTYRDVCIGYNAPLSIDNGYILLLPTNF